jgi:hypothetical protein
MDAIAMIIKPLVNDKKGNAFYCGKYDLVKDCPFLGE